MAGDDRLPVASSAGKRKKLTPKPSKDASIVPKKLWEKDLTAIKSKPYKSSSDPSPAPSNSSGNNFKKRTSQWTSHPDPKKSKKINDLLVKERKLRRPNAPLIADCLRIWSEFSPKTVPKQKKHLLIDELLDMIKGKIYDIVLRGTISRVIQSVIKEGNQKHRELVFNELKSVALYQDHVIDMAKNKYSHFLLLRMLKHFSLPHREYIIKQFYGHVTTLIRHNYASDILECIYKEAGSRTQQCALIEEFYSIEFATFKSDKPRNFEEVLAEYPDKKDAMLNFMLNKVTPVINKSDTTRLLNHTLIHVPVYNLIKHGSLDTIYLLITLIKDSILRFLHSREGAYVACQAIAYSSSKVRKEIIKSLKGFVVRVAKEEFGHLLLLRIFSCVDDTKLVAKVILSELKPNLFELTQDLYGKSVLLALLSPLNPRYFSEYIIDLNKIPEIPEKTDEIDETSIIDAKLVPTSLKDPLIRQIELYNAISSDFIKMIKCQMFRLISMVNSRDVLFETILNYTVMAKEEDKLRIYQYVLRLIGKSSSNETQQGVNIDLVQDQDRDDYSSGDEKVDSISKQFHSLDFLREAPVQEEDIVTHKVAHQTLQRFIEEEPGFAPLALKAIGNRLIEYSKHVIGSWVIYSFMQVIETVEDVKAQILPFLPELEEELKQNSYKRGLKAILDCLKPLDDQEK